jgi:hypothetical protein
MTQVAKSTSFVQDQKHVTKSDRFKVIQPSQIEAVLNDHGFDLVHLKTGKAKSQDRQDFQTTVARYRSRDNFEIQGLNMDLIFKVPHLYGRMVGVLGLFRGVCANQLNVGTHFETIKVGHTGDPLSQLDTLIPALVAQRDSLIETVKMMQARDVTPSELIQLAQDVAKIRLDGLDNVQSIQFGDLLKVRRQDDAKNDLFSVMNVLQENVIRFGLRYQTSSTDDNGVNRTRNMVARQIKTESVKAIDLNASIWDAASKLIAA